MLRPSIGDLLGGLSASLQSEVLPALADGPPRSQLKAALHLIARLQRSWDLTPGYITADNADIAQVLGSLAHDPATPPEPSGYNDPALRAAAARNLHLQAILAEQKPTPEMQALYRRMSARAVLATGDPAHD